MIDTVGIDLGTTNSVLAYVDHNGIAKCVTLSTGVNTFPSAIFYDGLEIYAGQAALDLESDAPQCIVRSSKRYMGTSHSYNILGRQFNPVDVAKHILISLKDEAESVLGNPIKNAVITVPAYFNDGQRKQTMLAGELAGLRILRIINEPTAASLAYGLNNLKNQKILVWDLGGGTIDLSVINLTDDGTFEVLATKGNTQLGGDDFDNCISNYFIDQIALNYPGILFNNDFESRIKNASELIKHKLSRVQTYSMKLPFIGSHNDVPISVSLSLTLDKFNELVAHLMVQIKSLMNDVMGDASLKYTDLNHIVLVGGSTRMWIVRDQIAKWTGITPNISLNPDEAVALGAAIQANILCNNNSQDILLIDVTPLSLGVEIENGLISIMIPRNSSIPCEFEEEYTTSYDNQKDIKVDVYQGERPRAKDNFYVGGFYLENIPPMPRGKPKIHVLFSIDANGILSVKATEQASNVTKEMIFEQNTCKQDISRILNDAQENIDDDEIFKELMTARNQAMSLMVAIQELLDTHKCSEHEISQLKEESDNLQEIANSENMEYITTVIKSAESFVRIISDKLYIEAASHIPTKI